MTANDVSSCGNLLKKQRPRIAGPGLQTSALPLGYGALADGRNLIDDAIATPATRMFATITGSEWISTPYSAHNPAATPCTRRSPVGVLVKYDTRNTPVASQPTQSNRLMAVP